ncbi:MAG: response regulator [Spirochaetaceae bacterium]|nr:response regulator [Myxococcales bacterium]MCB9722891.1 response regulator [Spirochaetaceae bacterium]
MPSDRPTVLLVDDEPSVLAALQRGLRREGLELRTADRAASAVACLEREAIDLVITDHRMPGPSGIELLALVRARWPATGRILLSGHTGGIPAEALANAQPSAVLGKPWDDVELRTAIRDALGRE